MDDRAGSTFNPRTFLAKVGSGRSQARYGKDEPIFVQGDVADAVFYIQSGKIKLTVVSEQGKEAVVAMLSSRDFFGEGCLTSQTRRISTATAMAPALVTRLEKSAILEAIRREPAFSELFIAHLLERAV
jgi:CRP-like cAMP-binding protein